MVLILDSFGAYSFVPVEVPYGVSVGANILQIGSFRLVFFSLQIISNIWMPMIADMCVCKRSLLLASVAGSGLGFLAQALAHPLYNILSSQNQAGVCMMYVGKSLAGLFGGTLPVVQAIVTDISKSDLAILKKRHSMVEIAPQAIGGFMGLEAGIIAHDRCCGYCVRCGCLLSDICCCAHEPQVPPKDEYAG